MLIKFDNELQMSELRFACNTGDAGLFSNVFTNARRGLPEVDSFAPTDQPAVVCGGGPSLADTLELVREMKERGARIFALNNAAKYLFLNGIIPDVHIILDARIENLSFIEKRWAGEILLCSQCHPAMFDKCSEIGYPVRIWHPVIEGIAEHIPTENPLLIGGGLTVGLSGLCLIYTLGHRNFHLFGYDSCHSEAKSHAYEQDIEKPDMVRVAVANRVFNCSLMMAGQASSFQQVSGMLVDLGCEITLHGDGLIQHMIAEQNRVDNLKVMTAVYDLSMSPPTYDFLGFLAEAERFRKAKEFDCIDIVFTPGPIHGFRDDQLPPDAATREGMLWRVAVAMAKRLPSVRNVQVLSQRQDIKADFPEEWTDATAKAHYGTRYLKNDAPMLKASEYARKQVALRYSKPYVTITLRESSYWPNRNSKRSEWKKVADWLKAQNIQPIIVPDAEGTGFLGDYTECREATMDLDIRCALYEGAVVNLGVLNGPMSLCAFLDCNYLIFNVGGENTHAGSEAFLAAHGLEKGDDLSPNGKLIWAPDLAENIIPHLTEKTSCLSAC